MAARFYSVWKRQHSISFVYRSYHLPMPDPSPSTLTVLNSNFLQLGIRTGGRPQPTVYPRRLPVNCETHCGDRTPNLPTVSPTRYQLCHRDHHIDHLSSIFFYRSRTRDLSATSGVLFLLSRSQYICLLLLSYSHFSEPVNYGIITAECV